jgi:hypothetical protein
MALDSTLVEEDLVSYDEFFRSDMPMPVLTSEACPTIAWGRSDMAPEYMGSMSACGGDGGSFLLGGLLGLGLGMMIGGGMGGDGGFGGGGGDFGGGGATGGY